MKQSFPKRKTIREMFTMPATNTNWQGVKDGAPFNVMSGLGTINDVLNGRVKKQEDLDAIAPKILPFPLNRIIDQLADSYEELLKVKDTLTSTLQSAVLDDSGRMVIKNQIREINKMIKEIGLVSKEVEKLEL